MSVLCIMVMMYISCDATWWSICSTGSPQACTRKLSQRKENNACLIWWSWNKETNIGFIMIVLKGTFFYVLWARFVERWWHFRCKQFFDWLTTMSLNEKGCIGLWYLTCLLQLTWNSVFKNSGTSWNINICILQITTFCFTTSSYCLLCTLLLSMPWFPEIRHLHLP